MSKKFLIVVGITILFLGVGIQPAIAIIEPEQPVNDDCNLCGKKVSKNHIDRLINVLDKLDKHDNELSALFRLNSELEEKYKAISNRFLVLKEINNDFNLNRGFPVICSILFIYMLSCADLYLYLYYFCPLFWIINDIGGVLNCDWYLEMPP